MYRMIPFLVLSALVLGASVCDASANGAKYICDTNKLASEDKCYFVADPSYSPAFTASGHNIDRSVAADGYRVVHDAAGRVLTVTPKPWDQGDVLAASTTKQEGYALNYALAFEMMAPLRDAVMYTPNVLAADEAKWNSLTKALVDCKIKDSTTINGPAAATSVADTYKVLKNARTQTVYSVPPNSDVHHSLLQFLEEGAIDLVCVMTDLVKDRCDAMRTKLGLAAGATSDCWKPAYDALYPASAGSTGGTTTPTSSPNSAAHLASSWSLYLALTTLSVVLMMWM